MATLRNFYFVTADILRSPVFHNKALLKFETSNIVEKIKQSNITKNVFYISVLIRRNRIIL